MNIEEIQLASSEIQRIIRLKPDEIDRAVFAAQLKRWRDAGLPEHTNEQLQQIIDDVIHDFGLIKEGRGSGDGRSHEQIISDVTRRCNFITTEAYVLSQSKR